MNGSRERQGSAGSVGRWRPVLVGVAAGLLAAAAAVVVAAGAVATLPHQWVSAASLLAVAVGTLPIGVGLGLRYREAWGRPALLAGATAAALLFVRGLAFVADGRPVSYPLLFGVPGAAVSIGGSLVGAWFGSRPAVSGRLRPAGLSRPVRVALLVAAAWTAIELVAGVVVGATLGAVVGNAFVGVLVATLVGFPLAAWVAARYGRRAGVERSDWDYDVDPRRVTVGLVAGGLTLMLVLGLGALVEAAGFGGSVRTAFGFLLADLRAGPWVLVLFALAHGIVAPLAEELAWRGVVQTALVRSAGSAVGILSTALLFTAKHAFLDASLARVPAVLVLALTLGAVRHRWGTVSSTLVHAVVNLGAVTLLAVAVFG